MFIFNSPTIWVLCVLLDPFNIYVEKLYINSFFYECHCMCDYFCSNHLYDNENVSCIELYWIYYLAEL